MVSCLRCILQPRLCSKLLNHLLTVKLATDCRFVAPAENKQHLSNGCAAGDTYLAVQVFVRLHASRWHRKWRCELFNEPWRWPREKATVVLLSCLLGSHPTRSRIIWGLRTGCKPATSVVCLLKALPHSDPPAVPAAAQALSSAVLRSLLYRVYRPMKAKSTLGPFRFQRDAKASPYSAQIVPG